MSEMVDRVARAMCREAYGNCVCDQATNVLKDCADKVRFAHAAIEAMREPTVDMFDRGVEAMQDMDGDSKPSNIRHIWPAMIDEALK